MKKRIVSLVLTLTMLLGLVAALPLSVSAATDVWDGSVASAFAGGNGSEENPWQIATAEQLAYMSSLIAVEDPSASTKVAKDTYAGYMDDYYILTADIVMNDVSNYDSWSTSVKPANVFTPIGLGTYSLGGFQGSLNGNGHSITGLYTSPGGSDSGLFDTLGGECVIENLAIVKSYFTSTGSETGAIASNIRVGTIPENGTATLQNIYVNAKCVGGGTNSNIAGLIGICQENSQAKTGAKLVIDSCVFDGTVTASGTYIAGILGNGNGFTLEISNCINLGDISASGKNYVCGILGRSDGKATLTNCINLGTITGSGTYRGELAATGSSKKIYIYNSYGSQSGVRLVGGSNKTFYNNSTSSTTNTNNSTSTHKISGGEAAYFGSYATMAETLEFTAKKSDVMVPAAFADVFPNLQTSFYDATEYTVTWDPDNGSTPTTEKVLKGERPTNQPADPTKTSAEGTYVFGAWEPSVEAIFADTTYTASYTYTANSYAFANGKGTEADPFQIASVADLVALATEVNAGNAFNGGTYASAYYKLTASIDMNNVEWTPIGTTDNPFRGDFDGAGKTLSNMYVSGSDVGLFGYIGSGANIHDLAIVDATVEGGSWVGALAGDAKGVEDGDITVSNIYVSADVSGEGTVGGLIGGMTGSSAFNLVIDSCVFAGTVTSTGNNAAGILGNANNAGDNTGRKFQITNCLNLGDISGKQDTAGIVGYVAYQAKDGCVIENCINLGTITATGGTNYRYGNEIVSSNSSSTANAYTLTNCYGINPDMKETVGVNSDITLADLFKADFTDTFTAWTVRASDVAIPTGVAEKFAVQYLQEEYTVTWKDGETTLKTETVATGTTPDYGSIPTKAADENYIYTFNTWTPTISPVTGDITYTVEWTVTAMYKPFDNQGTGTAEDPYIIDSYEDLVEFAQLMNGTHEQLTFDSYESYYNKCYKLNADIVANDISNYANWGTTAPANVFAPIGLGTYSKGGFQGVFDGNGKTITGLYVAPDGSDAGLFDCLGGQAVVKNLSIVKSYFTSTGSEVGAVASNIKAGTIPEDGAVTIQNIYVDAVLVGGGSNVGGVIGIIQNVSAKQSGSQVVIENCMFTGSATAASHYVGGIIGNGNGMDFVISNCFNLGAISGNQYVAGIVGRSDAACTVENCINIGTINGASGYIGEIICTNIADVVVVNNCYGWNATLNLIGRSTGMIDDDATDSGEYNLVYIDQLVGSTAFAETMGWTATAGDYYISPISGVAVKANYVGTLLDGASVRLATEAGLRFTSIVSKAFLTSMGVTEYGIILAPTQFITGDFTAEALGEGKFVYIPTVKLQEENDYYVTFTSALAPVKEANYEVAFSARLYFKTADGIIYGTYDEAVNSRSIAEVADKALSDLSKEQVDEYQYEVAGGAYSPYNADQRAALGTFAGASEVVAMSYNIVYNNVVDSSSNVLARPAKVIAEINSLIANNGVTVFGLQEVYNAWFDKAGLGEDTFANFTMVKGDSTQAETSGAWFWEEENKYAFYNPIFFDETKYEIVDGLTGTKWLSESPNTKYTKLEASSLHRAMTYAILRDKATGAIFMFVNTQLDTTSTDVRQAQAAIVLEQIEAIKGTTYADIPVIVGGDLNEPTRNNIIGTDVNENVTEAEKAGLFHDNGYKYAQDNTMFRTKSSDPTKVTSATYNEETGYYEGTLSNSMLDRFFVTNGCKVIRSETPYDTSAGNVEGTEFPSDHVPLLMYAIIK